MKLDSGIHIDMHSVLSLKPGVTYLNLEASLGHRSVEADIGSLLECVTSLSNIEYLNLGSNYNLRTIPESIGNLRKLNTLDLSFCESLQGCQLAYLQLTV